MQIKLTKCESQITKRSTLEAPTAIFGFIFIKQITIKSNIYSLEFELKVQSSVCLQTTLQRWLSPHMTKGSEGDWWAVGISESMLHKMRRRRPGEDCNGCPSLRCASRSMHSKQSRERDTETGQTDEACEAAGEDAKLGEQAE